MGKRLHPNITYTRRYSLKKLEEPMWAAIAERFKNGETCRVLAEDYCQPYGLVQSVLAGGQVRRDPGPKAQEAIRLYEGGCSYVEIARLLGCSKQNVEQLLKFRVQIRPHSRKRSSGRADMIARGEW